LSQDVPFPDQRLPPVFYGVEANAEPLFDELPTAALATKRVGNRSLLKRSNQVENLIGAVSTTLEEDWIKGANQYDGMLYVILTKEKGSVVPLYIGKAETLGKRGDFSANIKGVLKNTNRAMNEEFGGCGWY
jgi:hypothetical protein